MRRVLMLRAEVARVREERAAWKAHAVMAETALRHLVIAVDDIQASSAIETARKIIGIADQRELTS